MYLKIWAMSPNRHTIKRTHTSLVASAKSPFILLDLNKDLSFNWDMYPSQNYFHILFCKQSSPRRQQCKLNNARLKGRSTIVKSINQKALHFIWKTLSRVIIELEPRNQNAVTTCTVTVSSSLRRYKFNMISLIMTRFCVQFVKEFLIFGSLTYLYFPLRVASLTKTKH
jgi:hypothetical protein